MSSGSDSFNTDIFLKSSKRSVIDNINKIDISSSLFTESTPSKFYDATDSAFITKDLMHIHKKLLDIDLIPSQTNNSINSVNSSNSVKTNRESTHYSQYSQYGAGKNSIGDSTGMSTMRLPINYSESTNTDTDALRSAMEYAYKEVVPYANFSSTSEADNSSSSSSSEPVPPPRKVSRIKTKGRKVKKKIVSKKVKSKSQKK
jgi:hypothetical protein